MHARHILIKPNELQDDATVAQKLLAIRDRIVNKGENFAAVASVISEDPGSAAEGGDLGWTNPGTFVPEFEKQLAQLQPDEISQPFRTQFGWHIMQLLGRRQFDTTDEAAAPAAPSRRCAKPRPTKKRSCGCAGCATRRTSSTSSEAVAGRSSPRESPPASARISVSLCAGVSICPSSSCIGNRALLAERARQLGARRRARSPIDPQAARRRARPGASHVIDVPLGAPCVAGRLDPANARHVLGLLDRAIDGARRGEFAAMVTAPVQKSVINDAGMPFTGHTEYLASARAHRCRS